jgi:hypothetical protein
MDPAEPNLKVTDRRHFTAEGDLKKDLAPEETQAPAASESSPAETAAGGPEGGPVTFASFIISLAAQAADFIGGEQKDLGGARQIISALEMLKDKTEGRRTDDETRILEAILFDLRLGFVNSTKGTAT